MTHKFFTDDEISELVVATATKILDVKGVANLEGNPIRVIHRPLNLAAKNKRHQKSFFLISINGCSCHLLLNNEKGQKIKVGNVSTDTTHFDSSILGLPETTLLLGIIKDYLVTCCNRMVEDYVPEELERGAGFLGLGSRDCFGWLSGCLENHKYGNLHRLTFVDMIHG